MEKSYNNKKIAVLGLSVEGIETVKFLLSKKADIFACDQKSEKEIDKNILNFLKKNKVHLKLGGNYLDDLEDYSIIFRAPGMPLWHQKIINAKQKGIIIESLTKIFFDLCPGKIIGVTGTKGKGTTASLIYEILKSEGKKVFLGGNIGNPLINSLSKMDKNSWVVLELSSFQLEDLKKSPHIAVLLNIAVDHLASSSLNSPNYHKSLEDYISAKENIIKFQSERDFAVINSDYQSTLDLAKKTKADIWYFSLKKKLEKGAYINENKIYLKNGTKNTYFGSIEKILLRGRHNLENITAGITASYLAGCSIKNIRKAVYNFKGLKHRLELVKIINDVSYYNDSFSTTPDTTIAAIKSFSNPIILIAGGSEKGANYQNLGKEIFNSSVKVLILIGEMAVKIEKAVLENGIFKGKIIKGLTNMKEIIKIASENTSKNDVVLLSPGCASFDMFENYKDRGNQFKN